MQVEEFPERSGECDCKVKPKYTCHYPNSRMGVFASRITAVWDRIFGPACKFDHPPPSAMDKLFQQSVDTNSASLHVAESGHATQHGNQHSA
ncbi:hypothetical protein CR513_11467, partial [Mucuna pruriens]